MTVLCRQDSTEFLGISSSLLSTNPNYDETVSTRGDDFNLALNVHRLSLTSFENLFAVVGLVPAS